MGFQLHTLVDLLRWRSEHNADQLAYRFLREGEADEITLTYQALDRQARAIAVLLSELHCTGKRALLLYPPGLDYIAAFFGCLYAGVVAVPAYPPRPNRSLMRLQSIIADADAPIALTVSSILTKLEKRFVDHADLKALQWLTTDHLSLDLADDWTLPPIDSSQLALLQYTSGSTAQPKGVMISHDNLLHNSALIQSSFEDTEASSGVSWLPPYHDMGLIGGILQPLYVGATMTLMPPVAFLQKPFRWLQAISRYGATTSGGPNFAYDLCVTKVTDEQRQSLDLSRWTLAFSGAEPIQYETLRTFAKAFASCGFRWESFYPCYGMAETTLMVTGGKKGVSLKALRLEVDALRNNQVVLVDAPTDSTNAFLDTVDDAVRPEGEDSRILVGCGQSASPEQVKIVNPETCEMMPEGTVGEIWVAHSRSIAQGYWNRTEETAHAFAAHLVQTSLKAQPMLEAQSTLDPGPNTGGDEQAEAYLRTGDLGFLFQNNLFVTGRLKDLIIIRGRNHYPQDIELTVEQAHPALKSGSGAAFAVELTDTERLVVVQELERTALRQVNADEVFAAVRRQISESHDLQVFSILLLKTGSLPKTSSGKVQRHLCRAGFLDHQLQTIHVWEAEARSAMSFDGAVDRTAQPLSAAANTPTSGEFVTSNAPATHPDLAQQPHATAATTVVETVLPADRGTVPSRSEADLATAADIRRWMMQWLAQELTVAATTIDVNKPFAEYGLDSVTAVELADALQTRLGREVSPTLAYEYPTIEVLAQFLAAQRQGGAVESAAEALSSPTAEEADIATLVGELEGLSEEEIQALLGDHQGS